MSKVLSVKPIGKADVFNMTVSRVHNFMIHGGIIVKNCDAARYFCISRSQAAHDEEVNQYRDELLEEQEEDYEEYMTGGVINASYING